MAGDPIGDPMDDPKVGGGATGYVILGGGTRVSAGADRIPVSGCVRVAAVSIG